MERTAARRWRLVSLVETHPAAAFFALTLAISWMVWLTAFVALSSVTIAYVVLGAFGPALAAATVTRLRGGSVRSWLAGVLDWRVSRRRYVLALAVPLLLSVATGAVLVAVTGTFRADTLAQTVPMYPVMLAFTMLLGGGQEEFGWRGFALPALQERFDALTASVAIGVVWAVWHLPLFVFDFTGYASQSFAVYLPTVVGFSVVFTWLYNGTGGSIVPAIVLHGGINGVTNLAVAAVGPDVAADLPVTALFGVSVWLLAVALLVRFGRETLADGSATTLSVVSDRTESDVTAPAERTDVADD